MTEKKALKEFISLLPMTAIIVDNKGAILFGLPIIPDLLDT